MDDYISRNGTVEALCAMECGDDSEYCVKRTCEIFTTLMRLPAAPVREVKRGKWIQVLPPDENGNATYECSCCHKGEVHVPIVEVSYCWNCGADMREDGE